MQKDKLIVGIHHSGPIATAALIKNGELIAAAPEERFTRNKHDRSFPHKAIRFCLETTNASLEEVDHFAIGWNAGENVALKYRGGFSDWMRYPGEWLSSVPNHLLSRMNRTVVGTESLFVSEDNKTTSINYVDHHQSHARLAYEYSGCDNCAILIADGWSEQKVTTWYTAKNGKLQLQKSKVFPQSLGGYYASMTDYLGYQPFNDEWRVMGMAAYGNPQQCPQISQLIEKLKNGDYELSLKYFDFYNFDRPRLFAPALEELMGPARKSSEPLAQRHFDIAAAAQRLFEEVMTHILTDFQRQTGCENVALGGGVALNCLYNGKVTQQTPFKKCFVSFAPDDSGNSIGAAMELCIQKNLALKKPKQTSALGKSFSDDEIGEALEKYKIAYGRSKNVAADTAKLLASENIVGWLQGRSEFGQRALGHRSILALPKSVKMKDKVNHSIKYRESYRPFAPMVMYDRLHDFFITTDNSPVHFMEKAYVFKESATSLVPAVVHADGTGRLQTVDPASEPLVADLLKHVEGISDCPMLLNTSFNLNGEPVVNSPEDALRTFITSGLDALVMGSFIIKK